jgi:hypothetical protein
MTLVYGFYSRASDLTLDSDDSKTACIKQPAKGKVNNTVVLNVN